MNNSIFKSKKFFKNAIVIYTNGEKEIFDAILITDKGIYTGVVRLNNDCYEEFIDDDLISKDNIQKIIVMGNEGISKDIDFN